VVLLRLGFIRLEVSDYCGRWVASAFLFELFDLIESVNDIGRLARGARGAGMRWELTSLNWQAVSAGAVLQPASAALRP